MLNMEGFVEMCKYYTKALVDGKLPTITSHWDNLCMGEAHRIFQSKSEVTQNAKLLHIRALETQQQEQEQQEGQQQEGQQGCSALLTVHKAILTSSLHGHRQQLPGQTRETALQGTSITETRDAVSRDEGQAEQSENPSHQGQNWIVCMIFREAQSCNSSS